jgi:NodT family efflux transporter outer membrane factor (OMF) lipoprotein
MGIDAMFATGRRMAAVLVLPMLAGCAVGPDFKGATPWWSPDSWFQGQPAAATTRVSQTVPEPVDPNWWKLFHDPELASLEDRVAASNLDLRVAGARLEQSRAQLGIARADQLPTLDANGSYSRERLSQRGVISLFPGGGSSGGGSSGGGSFGSLGSSANGLSGRSGALPSSATGGQSIQPFDVFQYGFDASWELDFWGRVRREVESARASLAASAEDRRNTLVSVQAEVARDYIQLRGTQRNLQINHENLGSAQQSLALTKERATGGLTTDLDVANAQAQVDSIAAQIPALEQQEAQLINALSLLLGQPPHALRTELAQTQPIPPIPPQIPVGLPSELARRRPDIRQAEAQLHAATADIGVAVADFYPSVSLSGSVGLQALQFKDLGNWASRQYGFGPTISIPLFEGGKLKATLELRQEQQQQAYLSYQQTVLSALHDVDNALTAYQTEQRRHDQLTGAVEANSRALSLARQRYAQGISSFLDVLDAQRSLLASQLQLADSTTTEATNLVAVYKALGGGWEETYPAEGATSTASGPAQPASSARAAL